jgi:hypothetical protein
MQVDHPMLTPRDYIFRSAETLLFDSLRHQTAVRIEFAQGHEELRAGLIKIVFRAQQKPSFARRELHELGTCLHAAQVSEFIRPNRTKAAGVRHAA